MGRWVLFLWWGIFFLEKIFYECFFSYKPTFYVAWLCIKNMLKLATQTLLKVNDNSLLNPFLNWQNNPSRYGNVRFINVPNNEQWEKWTTLCIGVSLDPLMPKTPEWPRLPNEFFFQKRINQQHLGECHILFPLKGFWSIESVYIFY